MKIKISLAALYFCASSTYAQDKQPIQIEQIDIQEKSLNYFYNIDESIQTRTMDAKTVDAMMGTTSTNYYKSLQLIPSVNTETQDPYAITADQNSITVRGQDGDTFSKLSTTIEGIPFGVNVGNGATGYIVDKENISGVDFTTGLTPSNKGFGLGTTAGSLDLKLLKPKDEMGATLSMGVGTDSFQKVFLRADSGKINDTFSFFISSSAMENEKWKGEGDISRKNIELMSIIDISDTTEIELFGSYNVFDRYEYAPLSYEDTKSLDSNYNKDYNTKITGDAKTDAYYYDYYKQDFDEYFYYAALNTQIGDAKIKFKPYTFGSEGTRYQGTTSNGTVKKMQIDQEAYGMNLSFEQPLFDGKLYGGWWYQEMETTPPPSMQVTYGIESNGDLKFKSIGMLNDIEERVSNSPYLGYESMFYDTYVNVGLRYIAFDFPAVTGYNTSGLGDLSYDSAMSESSGVKSGMEVEASTSTEFLPSLAIEHQLNNNFKLGGGYARNYANPWQGPLWSIYNSKKAVFQQAGISLQDLWDELKLETSDNIEFFTQYSNTDTTLKGTLFYGKYKNKQVTVYDESLDLSYYKSESEATSMGVELELNHNFSNDITLFASMYYNQFEFDNDILLKTDTYLKTTDKQIPDVAKVGGKLGLNVAYKDFRFTPTARYVGKRYGDSENTEEVDPYFVFDVNAKYIVKKDLIELSLAVQNLLNDKYIGIVKNGLDDTQTGSTTYYQGAPFSAVLSMIAKF